MRFTKAKYVFLAIYFFLFSSFIQGITLDDFLNRVQETHPGFKQEQLQVSIQEQVRYATKAFKDINLSLTPSYVDQELITFVSTSPDKLTSTGLSSSVSKSFWATGGQLSFDLESKKNKINIPAVGKFNYHQNELALTYTQPLLKNLWGVNDRLNYDLSQLEVEKTVLSSLENQERLLLTVAHQYLDWVFSQEKVNIVSEQVRLAQTQLDQSRRKHKDNLVDKVDVYRAEDALYRYEQAALRARSQHDALQQELAIILDDANFRNEVAEYDLYTLKELQTVASIFSDNEELRVLKNISLSKQQKERQHRSLKNQNLPALNMVLQGSLKNQDENLEKSVKADFKNDYYLGVVYSKPLENSGIKGQLRQAEFQEAYFNKLYQHTRLNLKASLSRLYTEVEALKSIMTLNKTQIETAKKKTAEETRLYNQGRNPLHVVIAAQDNEKNLTLSYAANALQYQKMLQSYLALSDQGF